MKKYVFILFFFLIPLLASAQDSSWISALNHPSEDAKPWTFWYWMYGAVSKEGITKDLAAMHDAGLGGFYLMFIKGVNEGKEYHGDAQQLSPSWWNKIDWTFHVADSLGLKAGLHFADGFSLAGGPWITPAESMQKVVWTDTVVNGGKLRMRLNKPDSYQGYYADIALYAYPAMNKQDAQNPNVSQSFPVKTNMPCSIVISYNKSFTCRNVKIVTGGNNYQAQRFKIYASDNGTDYRYIMQLQPARQGWQNTDADATYSIPETTARFFRFDWSPEGSEPGSEDLDAAKWKPTLRVANIILSPESVINQYEGKSGLVWRVSSAKADSSVTYIPSQKFINLTRQLCGNDLNVKLPKGMWHIIRMGHTSTGHTNATGGGARGLECDKFNKEAIDRQFDNWLGAIYNHLDSTVAHRVLTHFHVDSWECGSQNWGARFAEEFKKRRGYDLLPWLPVYAGVPMASADQSEKVLRDVRITIAELVSDVFFREVSALSKKHGCIFSAESVAPTMVSDGMLHYKWADLPMGEFWYNSPTHDKPNDMLDAICGAHVYGKKIIQSESFTELRGTWDEHPAIYKALLDINFALGINKIFFHVNVHNPLPDKKPGMTLDGIGTFFQRDQTWWLEMHSFVDYIKHCQSLLQYGTPVADIAVYTGEEMPRRAVLPDRLVTSLPGLFGEERVKSEEKRLKNEGQPQTVSPVGVTHSANMALPEKWINPLHGYAYDSLNKDALLQATIKDGCIILPGGASYRVFVIPQARPMNPDRLELSPEVKDKISAMEKAGVVVISEPWRQDNLSSVGVQPDVILPEDIAYNHRSGYYKGEKSDIYFLSNQQAKERTFTASFRQTGRKTVLYNPLDGTFADTCATISNNRTEKTITLPPNGSVFVIFYENIIATAPETTPAFTKPLNNKGWQVTFENTGKVMQSDTLFDWSKEKDNSAKYYSGHAFYVTHFINDAKIKRYSIDLNLGRLENIATVFVNGTDCGTVWTYPYSVDISKAIKPGNNELRISVVNTWANALLGSDLGTPPFAGIWTNATYRRKENTLLLPAGLLGPVTLKYNLKDKKK